MLADRRRSAFPGEFIFRIGLVWLGVSAFLIAVNWGAISTMQFRDPDDALRLIQVRDLLAGQSWFDVTQYRLNAQGGGVPMHWSRLVDLPLALVILLLTPFFGSATAEHLALVIVPLITLGTAMVLAARIAWRLLGDEEATLTALLMALSVFVLYQLAPMRIDHHGWQLVCALAAMNGLMARSPIAGGRVIGLSLAAWLSISIEGLPLAAAIFAVLALRWIRSRDDRELLVHSMQSFAIGGIALFLLTRGIGQLGIYCDAIGPVHLAMFAWGAVVLTGLSRLEPIAPGMRLAGFAVAGGGALAIMFAVSPQCATGGGFAGLDPVVRDFWYVNVGEGRPIWHQSLTAAVSYAVTPLVGLYAAINLHSRSRDWLRGFWRDYAIILAAAILVSILVARAGATSSILAAPPLAWQVRNWLRNIRNMPGPLRRVGAMAAVAIALLPNMPLTMFQLVAAAAPETTTLAQSVTPLVRTTCRIEDSAAILQDLEPGEIFAPLDIAPKLLLISHHSVPASGHHRGSEAMRVVIETAISPADEAYRTLMSRGSRYLALCPMLPEPYHYAEYAEDGFVADLLAGDIPEWLEPIETAEESSLRLWRIKPSAGSQPAYAGMKSSATPLMQ